MQLRREFRNVTPLWIRVCHICKLQIRHVIALIRSCSSNMPHFGPSQIYLSQNLCTSWFSYSYWLKWYTYCTIYMYYHQSLQWLAILLDQYIGVYVFFLSLIKVVWHISFNKSYQLDLQTEELYEIVYICLWPPIYPTALIFLSLGMRYISMSSMRCWVCMANVLK